MTILTEDAEDEEDDEGDGEEGGALRIRHGGMRKATTTARAVFPIRDSAILVRNGLEFGSK